MALATDLIFRPLESPAQEAPNRRLANPGSGEEFSELLSKARTSETEPLGTAPQEFALAQAASPSLPLGAGLATLPAFSQDGMLGISAAGEPALGQPATDIAGTILPGIESAELAADTSLVVATQTGPGRVDPRSLKAGIAAAGSEGLPADSLPAIQSGPRPCQS